MKLACVIVRLAAGLAAASSAAREVRAYQIAAVLGYKRLPMWHMGSCSHGVFHAAFKDPRRRRRGPAPPRERSGLSHSDDCPMTLIRRCTMSTVSPPHTLRIPPPLLVSGGSRFGRPAEPLQIESATLHAPPDIISPDPADLLRPFAPAGEAAGDAQEPLSQGPSDWRGRPPIIL